MRALVQRVQRAVVRVVESTDAADGGGGGSGTDGEVIGSIGEGLCALVGVTHADNAATAVKLADKVWHLRVMADDAGVMNRSLADTGAAALVVSQFTLYGDTSRGRRPSWIDAARPEQAEPLVDAFAARLRDLGAPVATGRFGAHMHLELVNDGPVTLLLEV